MSSKAIRVHVLLLSGDIQTIDALCHCMSQLAMHVEVCADFASAMRKLCRNKFDGIVVDFREMVPALELLSKVRETTAHRAAVVLAILKDAMQMPSAFRGGASFALVKPLVQASLMRTVRASYPLMVRERRRYFRCPIQIPVCVKPNSGAESMATSVNISEGGMAMSAPFQLEVGASVKLRLTLPGNEAPEDMAAEVCWKDQSGRVGVEFVRLSDAVMERLQSWLAARLEESLPDEALTRG